MDLQPPICHLIPLNSLHRRLEGDLETLPHCGQWDSVHLLAYEIFLGSERDRFCYFYVYAMPDAWRGSMTLCLEVKPELLGMPAGPNLSQQNITILNIVIVIILIVLIIRYNKVL